jgi:hypothetical protein
MDFLLWVHSLFLVMNNDYEDQVSVGEKKKKRKRKEKEEKKTRVSFVRV